MTKLIEKWRKDADQYQRQVEEARRVGTSHDQMLSMMTALRMCAKELEIEMNRLIELKKEAELKKEK